MNIKIRYKGNYLGLAWIALEPTLTFLILLTVFSSIFVGSTEDFAIYFLTGIIFHNIFSRGVGGGLVSLMTNKGILQSSNIKIEFFPVASTVTAFIILLVEVAVFFTLMPFFEFVPFWTITLLPIVLFLLIVLTLGLSYLLSILFVYIKDVQPLWSVFAHSMIFITPIFWYLDDASGIVLEVQRVNPLGQLIELAHQIVVFGQVPPLNDWLYTAAIVFGILFVSFGIFKRFEKKVVEVI